ncbi:hypothetical protein SAZ11_05625 [Streptomyces sp. FXJ1.4098]|nr:hypothetical protein [Streptomyces sp. FXJ1.4098]
MLRTEIRDTGWPYQPLLPAAPIALPRASYAELFRATAALLDLVRRTAWSPRPPRTAGWRRTACRRANTSCSWPTSSSRSATRTV